MLTRRYLASKFSFISHIIY